MWTSVELFKTCIVLITAYHWTRVMKDKTAQEYGQFCVVHKFFS